MTMLAQGETEETVGSAPIARRIYAYTAPGRKVAVWRRDKGLIVFEGVVAA
ncbi:MAG: hypothetical protein ACTMKW_11010 [Brevibacterium aurantiacum]